jgi:hypothetical protein
MITWDEVERRRQSRTWRLEWSPRGCFIAGFVVGGCGHHFEEAPRELSLG